MKITDIRIAIEPNQSEHYPRIVARAHIVLEETILLNGFIIVQGKGGMTVGFPKGFLPDAELYNKVKAYILMTYNEMSI